MVALRKESVDRNACIPFHFPGPDLSLSARRAWIEIRRSPFFNVVQGNVALRKESVDRNCYLGIETDPLDWSLSARRAWIEIPISRLPRSGTVSLSARRAWIEMQ